MELENLIYIGKDFKEECLHEMANYNSEKDPFQNA